MFPAFLSLFIQRYFKLLILFCCVLTLSTPDLAHAVRIKDLASFSGVRDNQLVGYGLIVGLGGTGDKKDSNFTMRSMVSMLEKMGVNVDPRLMKPKNVAAVMVTARMPVSAKPGSTIDVTVSSIGDATSLLGGVLLQTPLKGVDGKVYGLAQGSLALGGISVEGVAGTAQKNITTVGRIPGGAIIEKSIPFEFNQQDHIVLAMHAADFSTTNQIAERINEALGGIFAAPKDASTINLQIPTDFRGNLVPLMASLENIEITPDLPAKIIVDEKTGTIVLGRDVRVSKVAVAHGNLQLIVKEGQQVSQPAPFSQGQTVVTPQTDIMLNEEKRRLILMEGATLQELVDGLNAVGATPRDLISILRALKASGSLHADLEVI
ncbi:flagellar basal body P-ring protein FlgI [Desulfovibrio litoralis]|uniref:Flagellar P-ring protein n=1 Tax=Desulfovibrio litoralis DSM 11393 TaxID=1121455 RepID=A0A1M7TFI2_9BACT|nr:flagellar basal body P-ring protein FlgI [Desulfovibrio litoralis]SHN69408.1 flagellar P-ring protein precursor FlgI [Desulfovibrio litoralis DSM 11393]